MDGDQRKNDQAGNDALASLPAAAQPRSVDGADPLSDPTIILQGSQMLGRAAWSAGRMAAGEGPIALYLRATAEKNTRDADEARQLERLEAWGRETTTVGGVEMTNAEAQEARQRVIDNDESYAQWAVKTGCIREDEKDDFKAAIRLKKGLEDKRGRGTLTEADAEKERQLDRSRAGQAADAATANQYQTRMLHGATPGLTGTALSETDVRGSARALDEYAVFKATAAASPGPPSASTPTAASVRATGLDL